MNKQAMLEALERFVNQRSRIDARNYSGSREAFMGNYRPMLKHGQQARTMLRAVELRDSITADALLKASRAYSGRLQFEERNAKVEIEYTTGQYFPTEYRAAACAVLAQCLWDHWAAIYDTADQIRKEVKRNLGRGIAATWFR